MSRAWRTLMAVSLLAGLGSAVSANATSSTRSAPATSPTTCQPDNLSPASRALVPVRIYKTTGSVTHPTAVLARAPTRLSGLGSTITVDFGKEVAGIVTLRLAGASRNTPVVGMAFTESPDFVGTGSDASNGGTGPDGAVTMAVAGAGSYVVPASQLRGGFRYLTVFMDSAGWIQLDGVALQFSAAPGDSRPGDYPNYFCSSDQLLNRIWYAGAYTLQLDTIDPYQGRVWGPPGSGWDNSGLVSYGNSVLVDGAKRDRTVWPADYGIEVPSDFASLGDMTSVVNGLSALYQHQDLLGAMPYAGPPVNLPGEQSDTYHLWTLIDTANYVFYSGDKQWIDGLWNPYKRALLYAIAKTEPVTGLFIVNGKADWQRIDQGGINLEANALMYRAMTTCVYLAQLERDAIIQNVCSLRAAQLKASANLLLWDSSTGAYRDRPGSTLHPQDGNSLAIWYGLTKTAVQNVSILAYLEDNWNSIGATTPEWNGNIHPFPGSMEVYARLTAGDTNGALALIRREWGYMLNSPQGTGSTFWEGYTANGTPGYNAAYPGAPAGVYTSLAHGWSTGPTGALTYYVLGINPTGTGGMSYQVIPHPGDLQWASGRLTMRAGTVSASWSRSKGTFSLSVTDLGSGTDGVIAVPRLGSNHTVYINGVEAWDGTSFLGSHGIQSADQSSDYIYFRGVQPGNRTFKW